MNIRFDNKRVIVTGAAKGFGRHIAANLVALGATVWGADVDEAELAITAKSGVNPKRIDLTDRAAVTAWAAEFEADVGPVDILINNAGGPAGAFRGLIENVSDAEWDTLININAGAAFAMCRAFVPQMKRAGSGRIVNISSGAGVAASRTGIHSYTAAKHAVVGLTRQLASEVGQFGITVNSVAPGFVRTTRETEEHWDALGDTGKQAMLNSIAMRRMGTPEDIGNAVLFFASGMAGWITGQVLVVDGGK